MHGECYARDGITYSLVVRPACTPSYSVISTAREWSHLYRASTMLVIVMGGPDGQRRSLEKGPGGMTIS